MAGYPEKIKRNKEIYEDKQKMSWTKLMQKWGLSYKTLYNIIKREDKRAESNV